MYNNALYNKVFGYSKGRYKFPWTSSKWAYQCMKAFSSVSKNLQKNVDDDI